jgi:small conductance mechanosensitive channel
MTLAQSIVQIASLLRDGLVLLWHSFVQFCDYIKINEYIIPFCIKLCILSIITTLIYSTTFIVRQWIKAACQSTTINKDTYNRIQKGAYYSIVILGIMIALQNLGIQLTPIITLLGIVGVAIGYALKEFIANIIAGLLILTYQPFKTNDYIKIKDWQGKVIAINIRYTTLQEDGMIILIPNSILYLSTVAIIQQ